MTTYPNSVVGGRRGSQSPYGTDPRYQSQMPPRGMMGDMSEMNMAIHDVCREAGYAMGAGDFDDYQANDPRSGSSRSMRDGMGLHDGPAMEKVRR